MSLQFAIFRLLSNAPIFPQTASLGLLMPNKKNVESQSLVLNGSDVP